VNSFTSLSLVPPLVLVCIDKGVNSHGAIAQSKIFAVNILARDQEEVSKRFADKAWEGRRFEGLPHRSGATGAPILDGAIAYIDCRVSSALEGGDHTIFVGRVEDLKVQREAEPLLFYRGKYARMGA
jgi:flavin reductase (DIM6/NTAB) family NADH-FMN oxidoreductase RutF